MSTLNVDAIVVSYNTSDLLRRCLASLDASLPRLQKVFVVDNASADGSAAMVRREFPDVELIEMGSNGGFAAANNAAFRRSRADAVLLLNPDAEVRPGTVAALTRALEDIEGLAAAGPALIGSDGAVQPEGARRDPTIAGEFGNISRLNRLWPRSRFGRDQMTEWDHRSEREVEVLSGACMLIRTAALGGTLFRTDFFMFGEDVELCQRLRRDGWRLRYCGTVETLHRGGASTRQARTRMRIAGVTSTARLFARGLGPAYAAAYLGAVAVAWPLGYVVRRCAHAAPDARSGAPGSGPAGWRQGEFGSAAPSARAVVFVNNYPGPDLGGGEIQLLQLIRGCVAAGIPTWLVCADAEGLGAEACRAGAVVIRQRFGPQHSVAAVRRIRSAVRAAGASIVQGTGYYTGVLCRLAGSGLPVHVVNAVHVEGTASLHDGGSLLGARVRAAADRASRGRVDAFVAVSEAVKDGLVAVGVHAADVVVIHNGVDAGELRALAARAPSPAAPALGPLVGVVARLEPVKGVAGFVRAAAELADGDPQVRFMVVGSGSQMQRLRRLADDLGLRGRIAWVGTVRPVAPLLGGMDVVVVPSESEGLSIVALEAMALAKPVVATAVGGLPEVVVDGTTGLLVEPADHRALARAVGALLADPERSRAMGEAASARVEALFTVERMVDAHLELYGRLAAGGRAS